MEVNMVARIAIKDICKIYDGPHATPQKTNEGPVYLGIDAITDDGKVDPNQFSHLSEKDYIKWTKRVTPQYGDIVFSYEATLGRYALIPKDFYGCLGRRLAVIRNISSDIDTTWLYYYFRSAEWTNFIQSKIVKGSTVNRISIEDFPHYTIPCVPIETQKKIVDVLARIDRKIQINDAINDNLAA
jgi:type I restriction enzyme S subunit